MCADPAAGGLSHEVMSAANRRSGAPLEGNYAEHPEHSSGQRQGFANIRKGVYVCRA